MRIAKERVEHQRFVPIWIYYEHLARYMFASNYVPGKVVLDCGCGDAISSEMFYNAGASVVYAIDRSCAVVEQAVKRCVNDRIMFIVGDATSIPLPDELFDVYVSLETIEHIYCDSDYLREAVRLLKPEGVFICSTPNRIVYNPGKPLTSKSWNPFHVREYSQSQFTELLLNFWGEIEIFGQNPQSGFVVRLMEFLGRRLPGYGAVRINQTFKLPRFLFDRLEQHKVMRGNDCRIFEFIVAVCRKPKKHNSAFYET